MKKKALFSSILTIALCLCLIAGSTFALFTSETKVSISVTAGKVEMIASVDSLKLYSVEAKDGGTEVDEFGNTYEYVEQTGEFANTGTAVFDESTATLTLDRITPGDKVEFNVTGANNSDVKILYRYKVTCTDGFALMSGLVVTIDGTKYESLSSFTSPWAELAAGTAMNNVPVAIELPVKAGNEYQTLSTAITVTVEAVQANAKVEDNTTPVVTYLKMVDNKEDLLSAIQNPDVDHVALAGTIDLGGKAGNYLTLSDANINTTIVGGTIKGTGWTGELNYGVNATAGNIVFDGVTFDTTGWTTEGWANWGISVNVNGTANVTFKNCTFKGSQCPIYQSGADSVITLENCKFESTVGAVQCEIYSGDFTLGQNLIVKNCDFTGMADVLHIYDYDKDPTSEAIAQYLTDNGNTFTGVCKQTCK